MGSQVGIPTSKVGHWLCSRCFRARSTTEPSQTGEGPPTQCTVLQLPGQSGGPWGASPSPAALAHRLGKCESGQTDSLQRTTCLERGRWRSHAQSRQPPVATTLRPELADLQACASLHARTTPPILHPSCAEAGEALNLEGAKAWEAPQRRFRGASSPSPCSPSH